MLLTAFGQGLLLWTCCMAVVKLSALVMQIANLVLYLQHSTLLSACMSRVLELSCKSVLQCEVITQTQSCRRTGVPTGCAESGPL